MRSKGGTGLRGPLRENSGLGKVVADMALNNQTMWPHTSLETCSTRCPQDVEVAEVIDAMKATTLYQESIRRIEGLSAPL